MKHFLWSALVFVSMAYGVMAAPVILDFSRSHAVSDLNNSTLQIVEVAGGLDGQAYSFQNQELEIHLPANRSIILNAVQGTIDTKGNQLTRFSMYGHVMPHDQAVLIGRAFLECFNLPLTEFSVWEENSKNQGRNVREFSVSANYASYPRIGFGIVPSMNGLYPWVVDVLLSWNWDKQRDWNEERAWKELSPPAPGRELISLNSPNGLTYERKTAYSEIIAESEVLQKRVNTVPAQPSEPVIPAKPELKPTIIQPVPEVTKVEEPESTGWIAWTVAVIGVISGLWLWFKKRK